MDNEKIGQFISELRKSRQMTQKDLADKLNVSDKAVSKWERGLSYPDITLLPPLSGILGVTTTELLNGERAVHDEAANVDASVANALDYGDKAAKRKIKLSQNIWAAAFSMLLFIGIVVVSIVDMAITGAFTWSLIPIASIVFAWLICFPAIKFGAKGLVGSFISLSVFVVPFLFALSGLIGGDAPILPIGIRVSAVSIAFLWIYFGIYKKLKLRKLIALAVELSLLIPFTLLINFAISSVIGGTWFDVWDAAFFSLVIIAAVILVFIDICNRKSKG